MIINATIEERNYSLVPSVELYIVHDFMGKELPGLAIELFDAAAKEPYGILTVCFGEFIAIKNAAYIDSNNMPPEILKACLDAGIAKETILSKSASFGKSYPLWIFDEDFLRNNGSMNYRDYETVYSQYMKDSL